jgi:hypothetical protein
LSGQAATEKGKAEGSKILGMMIMMMLMLTSVIIMIGSFWFLFFLVADRDAYAVSL